MPAPAASTPVAGAAPAASVATIAAPPGPGLQLVDLKQVAPSAGIRLSRRQAAIAGGVVGVLVLGLVGYLVFRPGPPTGAGAVKGYFAALGKGDTAAALAYVDTYGSGELSDQPLLAAAALADPATRPTSVTIVSSQSEDDLGFGAGSGAGSVEIVQVSYSLGGQAVTQTITATRASDSDGGFLLEQPFLQLDLSAAGGRAVTVNGIHLDANQTYLSAFPGVYTATIPGSALLVGDTQAAVIEAAGGGYGGGPIASFAFAAPALAPGVQSAVNSKVHAAIDDCARSTLPQPQGCPFGIYVYQSNVTVTWTVATYPTVDVEISGSRVYLQSRGYGEMNYQYTYASSFDGSTQTSSGQRAFYVSGTVTAVGDTITVTLSQY